MQLYDTLSEFNEFMQHKVQIQSESPTLKETLETERCIQTFLKYINRFLGNAEDAESIKDMPKIKLLSSNTGAYTILYRLLEYT